MCWGSIGRPILLVTADVEVRLDTLHLWQKERSLLGCFRWFLRFVALLSGR
jgi:hypothetical protein